MASNKSKKYNLKKGLLGRYGLDVTPVIVQTNDVIRIEPELDQSRAAKKKRRANQDAKSLQQPKANTKKK